MKKRYSFTLLLAAIAVANASEAEDFSTAQKVAWQNECQLGLGDSDYCDCQLEVHAKEIGVKKMRIFLDYLVVNDLYSTTAEIQAAKNALPENKKEISDVLMEVESNAETAIERCLG